MAVKLSADDSSALAGQRGPAVRLALSIIVRMAEVCGAEELMDITQAHIDCCALTTQSSIEFAEQLVGLGARVAVPTTLSMLPLDIQNWKALGVPSEFAEQALRVARAYTAMGGIPTWTCAPYEGFLTPRVGQQIAWGESNAIVYANSVLGARTNRYGDFMDICAAIAGRVPRTGLHLEENRRGEILVRMAPELESLAATDEFYPVLGHLIGHLVQDRIPVIEGLDPSATRDQLKAFGAAAASAGAVGLFHAVGITPEAPTVSAAFAGAPPQRVIEITRLDVLAAYADLSTSQGDEPLGAVLLGCPHFSYTEFERLAACICELREPNARAATPLFVLTSQATYALLQRSDLLGLILGFGVRIVLDTCFFQCPFVPETAALVMTNSGKCAYYAPGGLGARVVFGSLRECVASAAAGKVLKEDGLWKES